MNVIGIDVGKSGALAVIESGNLVDYTVMPVSGNELDLPAIAIWIDQFKQNVPVFIEKVHAMPGQGVSSMFSFGTTYGALQGIVAALGHSYYLVPPQTWKKVILEGTAKDKDAAIAYCRRVFPQCDLRATLRSRTAHDGIADAICIAQYGYLKLSKER